MQLPQHMITYLEQLHVTVFVWFCSCLERFSIGSHFLFKVCLLRHFISAETVLEMEVFNSDMTPEELGYVLQENGLHDDIASAIVSHNISGWRYLSSPKVT